MTDNTWEPQKGATYLFTSQGGSKIVLTFWKYRNYPRVKKAIFTTLAGAEVGLILKTLRPEQFEELKPKNCSYCVEPVERRNDANLLQMIVDGETITEETLRWSVPRHLLPTQGCPGSRSRAQYLIGQLRDTQLRAEYQKKFQAPYRKAYKELRKRFPS